MKRSLMAVLLVVALVMSCIGSASAAVTTKNEFFTLCKELGTEIIVPVNIEGSKNGGEYEADDKIIASVDDDASFRAEIDMTNVIATVTKVLSNAETALQAGSTELAAFEALEVVGQFEITATWTGVTAPDDIETLIPVGFTGLGDIFVVDTASIEKTADNSVKAVINVADGTTVVKLKELAEKIELVVGGFKVVSDGEMNATITGTTQIKNDLTDSYDVAYKFMDGTSATIKPVDIDVRTGGGGGGSTSVTTFYNLKYDTNGGTEYAAESHREGKKVELTKVPEKEGFVFAGWYSDAELTNKITAIEMTGDKTVYAAWTDEEGGEVAHPVPDVLNGEEHFAYLNGYPDGTIRPIANITRAEVATIFFRLLKNEVRAENLTTTNNFADVSEDAWYNTAVSTMAKLGVVAGRTPDTFAPDEYITRAEFATICARFDDADEKCEDCGLTDIAAHWAEDYILEAVAYKWINGYEDNTFRPDNFITRAEAATLINRVLVRLPEDVSCLLEGMKTWPDNSDAEWYYIAIQEATNSHTYGRIDAVNEKWNTLEENFDWTVYED
ncbi:MAG: S-layer homology domain-containing protein [Clostridia bacterium]|nr:S-layer homology domain-containing protein [Clostridia bacterium]